MRYLSENFWRHSSDVFTLVPNACKFLVCLSTHLLAYLLAEIRPIYFLTEIRQIWGYLHFWMIYLSEIFLRHSLDIGSLVFTWLDWAYILTFEFLCAGLNFETSDLVTFWLSEGQLLRPSGLVCEVLQNS